MRRGLAFPRRWLGSLHRISGRLAFLASLPVAYHCLYQLAFQDSTTRVLLHSLFGCAFYGAFAGKVVIVRSRSLPLAPARCPAPRCRSRAGWSSRSSSRSG